MSDAEGHRKTVTDYLQVLAEQVWSGEVEVESLEITNDLHEVGIDENGFLQRVDTGRRHVRITYRRRSP